MTDTSYKFIMEVLKKYPEDHEHCQIYKNYCIINNNRIYKMQQQEKMACAKDSKKAYITTLL